MTAKPIFFATPADWRAWLQAHHATATIDASEKGIKIAAMPPAAKS